MKRVFLFVLVICFICISMLTVYADVVYVKTEEHDWSSETVSVAANADTGEIIPLSDGPYDGYLYAYLPQNAEIVEKKIVPPKFSDIEEYDLYVESLSAKGVLLGNGDGTFLPEKELTRAEMAVIFARLFSVPQSDREPVFSDTPRGEWFTPYIMALYEKGVFAEDEFFNPNAFVTREQLVTMTHRMLSDMGYIKDMGEAMFETDVDVDSISEFALKAYNDLRTNGYMIISDCVDNDPLDFSDDRYEFLPQKAVTRYECASFLYYIVRDFIRINAPAIRRENAPEEEIPVLDGSTSTYAISNNIYNAYYLNSRNAEGFLQAHSKTSNAYKRLIDGEVEMIFVPDASEEITKYAEEKGVKLEFVPIANEALVFFTSKENTANNVTTDNLHEIYVNNGIKSWKELGGDDVPLTAYCRNNDSGSHAQMEKFILRGDEINEDISRERTSYIMSSILTDVDSFNRENKGKYALGYSLYYYFNMVQTVLDVPDLKLLPIDGIEPSDKTIASGEYPYTTCYYAVVRDEENERVEKFLKLLRGEFGEEIMAQSGFKAAEYKE